MTNLFYSQVEGVPGSRTIFFSFNYPILITYLFFIYCSDVRFFILSYISSFIYLFPYLFIYFYLFIYYLLIISFIFICLFIYLFTYLVIYSDIVLLMLLSVLL